MIRGGCAHAAVRTQAGKREGWYEWADRESRATGRGDNDARGGGHATMTREGTGMRQRRERGWACDNEHKL